jgi:hypothetical protein
MNQPSEPKSLPDQMLNYGHISQDAYHTWERIFVKCDTELVKKITNAYSRSGGAVLDLICVNGMSLDKASSKLPYTPDQISGMLIIALDVADNIYREAERYSL